MAGYNYWAVYPNFNTLKESQIYLKHFKKYGEYIYRDGEYYNSGRLTKYEEDSMIILNRYYDEKIEELVKKKKWFRKLF